MAANARALGHCFNPISVFWCHRRSGELAGVVVEVHNTYGDRHAYLVHPDEQGRARTEKQMYVSPFHGTDGYYEIAVPRPGDRLHVVVTLHSDDGAVFTASLDGDAEPRSRPSDPPPPPCAAPCSSTPTGCGCGHAVSGSASVPTIHDRKASEMTTTPLRPSTTWAELDNVPTGFKADVSARIARQLFRAAVRRLPVTVREGSASTKTWGTGGPEMRIQRARGVLRAPGSRRPDRLRRGLPHRRLGRRGPRRLPHRAGRRPADADPCTAPEAAGRLRAPAAEGARRTPRTTPATTSRTTTTCPTTCSSCSSTRR